MTSYELNRTPGEGFFLAIVTSCRVGSLALFDWDGPRPKCVASTEWDKLSTHSEVITVQLQLLLEKANLPLSALRWLVVDHGPGSFTGVRVGINLARTLAYALKIPAVSFSSLRILAEPALIDDPAAPVVSVLSAFRNLVYAAVYQRDPGKVAPTVVLPPTAMTKDELAQTMSRLADSTQTIGHPEPELPRALDLGHLVISELAQSQILRWNEIVPIYLRDSEPEEKLRTGELKPVREWSRE